MRKLLTLTLFITLSSAVSMAQHGFNAGLFNSAKGFGVSAQLFNSNGSEFNTLTVYGDAYGIFSGRTREAGVFANLTHNYVISTYSDQWMDASFFAGAGIGGGYVHDYEAGLFSKTAPALTRPYAVTFGLAGELGMLFSFTSVPVCIAIHFTANPGVAFSRKKENGSVSVSLYKNGIFHSFYPHISIMRRF